MTPHHAPNPVRSLAMRLLIVLAASCLGSAAIVGGLSRGDGGFDPAAFGAAGLGAAAVFVSGLLGVSMFSVLSEGSPAKLPLAMMASSTIRLIGTVGLGLGLFLLAEPAGKPFWYGLLAAGLVSLVLETRLFIKALGRPATMAGGEGTAR